MKVIAPKIEDDVCQERCKKMHVLQRLGKHVCSDSNFGNRSRSFAPWPALRLLSSRRIFSPPHSTSSSLSLPVPRRGVTGQIGPIFKLLLFSRFFGIQLAAPHRAGRLGDAGRERSCIAFSQTLYGPRGLPRDWASKQRAFEHS